MTAGLQDGIASCLPQPILGAIDSTAAQRDGYSPRCSCTILTARSRTSGENLFDLFMAQSSQSVEPPQKPGRLMEQGRRPRELSLQQYLGLAGQLLGPRTRWLSTRNERIHVPMLAQSFLAVPGVVAATDLIATVPALSLEGAPLQPGVRVLQPPLDLPPLHGGTVRCTGTNGPTRTRAIAGSAGWCLVWCENLDHLAPPRRADRVERRQQGT